MILHEVLNGVSMAVPVAVLLLKAPHSQYGLSAMLSTTIHACVSCGYHLTCATNPSIDPAECLGRKLDQTFIHMNAIVMAYCTSHSWRYTVGAASINTKFIRSLWLPTDTSKARRRRIFISYVVIVAPIFLKDVWLGAKTVAILLLSISAFLLKTRINVGHTLFHCGIGVFCNELVKVL